MPFAGTSILFAPNSMRWKRRSNRCQSAENLLTLTELMSRVGKASPNLMKDRNVSLFVLAFIDEVKKGSERTRWISW